MTTITATYSPEDNKIRLYASSRLNSETYGKVKAAGFSWAPKQELFVAPKWTPSREDLAIELAGDIEQEESTLEDRAIAKAERLEALALKRKRDSERAADYADTLSEAFAFGQPILVGHHSERKARKTHERMTAAQTRANKLLDTANHWLYKSRSVVSHAEHKNSDRTRANRIKTLLADLRDVQRDINAGFSALQLWEKIPQDVTLERLERLPWDMLCLPWDMSSRAQKEGLTGAQLREIGIRNASIKAHGPYKKRWIEHIFNRLAYERATGGEVGRYEGELTPVIIQAFARELGAEKPKATQEDESFTLESPIQLPELIVENASFITLTGDEWRDLMQELGHFPAEIVRRKSTAPKAAPLIHLTQEDAEKIQEIWNRDAARKAGRNVDKPTNVRTMTQAHYSECSKGTYGVCKTVEIDNRGLPVTMVWRAHERVKSGEAICRIRVCTAGMSFYSAHAVVVISDATAKPLPFELVENEA